MDARSGMSVTWGRIEAGHACNVIPMHAELSGTVRCLDLGAWHEAPDMIHAAIDEIATMHGAKFEINHVRGVPPVVNDPVITELLREAMAVRCGAESVEDTEQSLGGEDFSWYLEHVPGAMARLGVRTPGDTAKRDLHRGRLRRGRVRDRRRRGVLHGHRAARRTSRADAVRALTKVRQSSRAEQGKERTGIGPLLICSASLYSAGAQEPSTRQRL